MPGTDARLRVASVVIALLLAAPAAARAAAGDVVLVSRAAGPSGVSGNGGSSFPAVSPDGHLVAFQSSAKNLTPDSPASGTVEAYVRNVGTNTIALVSRADTAAGAPADAAVSDVAMSDDGRYVVFHTRALNLGPARTVSARRRR
jgi:Tol biopolymer transport system component